MVELLKRFFVVLMVFVILLTCIFIPNVYALESGNVESITLIDPPEEAYLYELLDFGIDADFGADGIKRISSTDYDVKISGLDTVGSKNANVSYLSATKNFPVTVNEFNPEILFSQKFATVSEITKNFPISNFHSEIDYHWEVANGKLIASYPQEIGDFDANAQLTSILKSTVCSAWGTEPYEIILNTSIDTNAITPTKRTTATGFSFAKDKESGGEYIISVDSNGQISISCTNIGKTLYKDNINAYNQDLKVNLGEKFELKVQISENMLKAYFDENLICILPLEINSITSYFRLRANNGTISFYDLAVETIQTRDYDYAEKISLKQVNNRQEVAKISGADIYIDDYYLEVTYPDGYVDYITLSKDMLSGYEKGKSSKVGIICGNVKTYFDFVYEDLLFADRFEEVINSGWTRTNSQYFSQTIQGGRLKTDFNYTGSLSSDYFTVTRGNNWTDYTVSTDFSFDGDVCYNSYIGYFNLLFRYQNSQNYYMFSLSQNGSEISGTLTLYKSSLDSAYSVASFKNEYLSSKLKNGKKLAVGETYSLAVTCIGNRILVYFEDALICSYEDKSDDALMYGTAGIRHQNFSGTTDNFIVEEEPCGFDSITLNSVENNTFKVYEGGQIEPDGVTVTLNNSNGGQIELPLKAEMLSGFDNLSVGTHSVTLTTPFYSDSVYVEVISRRNYIANLKNELENLTDKTKENLVNLKKKFDSLTTFEVSLLGENAVENLKNAIISLDKSNYQEISNSESVVFDTMNSDTKWKEDFNGRNVGFWNYRNGYLAESQIAYNLFGVSVALHPQYVEGRGVAADVMKIDGANGCAIVLNRNKHGYYYLRMTDQTSDGKSLLQLRRREGIDITVLASVVLEDIGFECKSGEWFNLAITYSDGILRGYYNGVQVLSCDDSANNLRFEKGYCGYYVSGNDFRADNLRIYGTALEEPEEAYVEPVVYTDNFEDETVGIRPSHWIEPATFEEGMSENYKVYSLFGSKVYGTKNTAENTMSYLHAFDKNTVWESDFYVGDSSSASIIGFVFKMAPETTYVKVGYSFGEKRWFLYEEKDDGSEARKTYSEKTYNLSSNTKHTVKIQFDDKKFSLIVNGEEVIKYDNVVCDGYGRMGMYTEKVQMYVDNVNITLNSGILPNDGVLEFVFGEPAIGYSATQVIDMGDGLMIAVVNKGKHAYRSRDWGETWEDITLTDGAELLSIQNGYPEIIKLSNGKYISIRSASFEVYISNDMLNWEYYTQINLPYTYNEDLRKYIDDQGRSIGIQHINSLIEFTMPDGKQRLMYAVGINGYSDATVQNSSSSNMKTITFYSDDYGMNWTQSDNDTTAVDVAYKDEYNLGSWGESKFLFCPDGGLRMYNTRSFSPYLVYTESKDYGKSWSGLYSIPEIQIPVASITIEEDPYEKGTFYMAWVNNAPQYHGSGSPRIRLSLAKSTDGVNWKYLTDIERMVLRYDEDRNNTTQLYQIIDPSMTITENHIYVNYGRSQSIGDGNKTAMSAAHGLVGRRFTKIEKETLSEMEWSAANIADVSIASSMEMVKLPQTRFRKGDKFDFSGGVAAVKDFYGNFGTYKLSELTLLREPDMNTCGRKTVTFYYENYLVSYEIEVVSDYNDNWEIDGETLYPVANQKDITAEGFNTVFWSNKSGVIDCNGDGSVLRLNANRSYNKHADAKEWQNFIWESDVTIHGANSARHVGLMIYTTANNNGYFFGISRKRASLFDMAAGSVDDNTTPSIAYIERNFDDESTHRIGIAV